MASALLTVTWTGLDEEILKIEGLGMIHSGEMVGDGNVDDPDHHGTAKERRYAVEAGMNFV